MQVIVAQFEIVSFARNLEGIEGNSEFEETTSGIRHQIQDNSYQ